MASESLSGVTAVTVTFNSMDVIDDFLSSVQAQEGRWRLVIVDNLSTDGTRARLSEINDDRIQVILNDENSGFAAGSNLGIRSAIADEAEAILLINNDTVFGPSLFADLAHSLRSEQADAVSPLIVYHDDPSMIWYAGGELHWRRGVRNIHAFSGEALPRLHSHVDSTPEKPLSREDYEYEAYLERTGQGVPRSPFRTPFAPACCLLVDRSVFERIGVLDEDFFCYWEDAEFCNRMGAAGLRIAVMPDLIVRHKASTLTGGTSSDFFIHNYERNRILFMRKARGRVSSVLGAASIAGNILARFALGREGVAVTAKRLKGVAAGMALV